ncbi:gluconate 2-dehydrogenase subunit 3 family protein [Limobrevibacterium gyesilva]|uniref:Gluconate 2-dehydrogenase subunit 3 family protein n=1 Tax=Limobrevibacterium gyesilva TaxID=2991712 RepID=A0AA41YPS1_9PROT|nr:gluconate 2-dehydrogenase subunit 3 family protein [Limobrevibacterium gyesilva]MCW3474398.1 gluconate 2-dehydrogenase subunit 3 family protein [Limobrevibacterium gyesilva]
MRDVDRRTRVSRRIFLRGSATAVPAAAAAAAGMTVTAESAWAQAAKNLKPQTMATLVKAARDTYPHDRLADSYYITAVAVYDSADPTLRALMESGVAMLDAEAKKRFGTPYLDVLSETDRVSVLRAVEGSPFFKKLRGDLVVTLYNQKPVWVKFGYEGASADKGGYINRGFNDLDWLPEV